jgi:hypothetical protein
VRELRATDLAALAALDRRAFGADRGRLIESLAQHGGRTLVAEREGTVKGFGLVRPGAEVLYMGPLVAESAAVARDIIQTLSRLQPETEVVWDIPMSNVAAVSLAEASGFRQERTLERMVLGEDLPAREPELQYAIAGPALG